MRLYRKQPRRPNMCKKSYPWTLVLRITWKNQVPEIKFSVRHCQRQQGKTINPWFQISIRVHIYLKSILGRETIRFWQIQSMDWVLIKAKLRFCLKIGNRLYSPKWNTTSSLKTNLLDYFSKVQKEEITWASMTLENHRRKIRVGRDCRRCIWPKCKFRWNHHLIRN